MSVTIELKSIDDLDHAEWARLTENSFAAYNISQEVEYAKILHSVQCHIF